MSEGIANVDVSEIEVTPEMERGGYDVLFPYCPELASLWDLSAEVYRAMEQVRRDQMAVHSARAISSEPTTKIDE